MLFSIAVFYIIFLLYRLETSVMTGVLRTFHELLRSAKFFNMTEAVKEYCARFRHRVTKVKKQLMQATIKSYEEKSLKQLLLEGSKLGLETEMDMVIRHIRQQILVFVKELIDHTKQSIGKRDNFFGKWRELHLRGKGFGIRTYILKDLLKSIEKNILLEHTKMKRSIVGLYECDLMGCLLTYNCKVQKAFFNVKALTLGYYASNRYYITNPNICLNSFVNFMRLALLYEWVDKQGLGVNV